MIKKRLIKKGDGIEIAIGGGKIKGTIVKNFTPVRGIGKLKVEKVLSMPIYSTWIEGEIRDVWIHKITKHWPRTPEIENLHFKTPQGKKIKGTLKKI